MEHPSKREYAEEWELIQFFGQDCDPLDKDEAEFFGRSRFTMTLDRDDARGVRNGTARSTGAVEADTEAAVVLGLKARVIAPFPGPASANAP